MANLKTWIKKNSKWIIYFLECLAVILGGTKLFFLSVDQTIANEIAFKSLSLNTKALHYLQLAPEGHNTYIAEAGKIIKESTSAILEYYGQVQPSCFFKAGVIPFENNPAYGIPYTNLTLSVHMMGPAGPLFDRDLAAGMSTTEGTKCDGTIESIGTREYFSRQFRYGNFIEILLLILAFVIGILKYYEIKSQPQTVIVYHPRHKRKMPKT